MLVANFNLSSAQMQVLLAFRHDKDTRVKDAEHPIHLLNTSVVIYRKLCAEGYIEWHAGDREKKHPPGYTLTPKGEMMLRLIEDELRRTLQWFEGKPLPESEISGGKHAVAAGKATLNKAGIAVAKKRTG